MKKGSRLDKYSKKIMKSKPDHIKWFENLYLKSSAFDKNDRFLKPNGKFIAHLTNEKLMFIIEVIHSQMNEIEKFNFKRKRRFFKKRGYRFFKIRGFKQREFDRLEKIILHIKCRY